MRFSRIVPAAALLLGAACATPQPAPTQTRMQTPTPARVYTPEEVRASAAEISTFLGWLVQWQREYYQTESRYAPTLGDLGVARASGYDVRIVEATDRGWAAEAFRASPRIGCSVFGGVVATLPQPSSYATIRAGQPYCAFLPPVPLSGVELP